MIASVQAEKHVKKKQKATRKTFGELNVLYVVNNRWSKFWQRKSRMRAHAAVCNGAMRIFFASFSWQTSARARVRARLARYEIFAMSPAGKKRDHGVGEARKNERRAIKIESVRARARARASAINFVAAAAQQRQKEQKESGARAPPAARSLQCARVAACFDQFAHLGDGEWLLIRPNARRLFASDRARAFLLCVGERMFACLFECVSRARARVRASALAKQPYARRDGRERRPKKALAAAAAAAATSDKQRQQQHVRVLIIQEAQIRTIARCSRRLVALRGGAPKCNTIGDEAQPPPRVPPPPSVNKNAFASGGGHKRRRRAGRWLNAATKRARASVKLSDASARSSCALQVSARVKARVVSNSV